MYDHIVVPFDGSAPALAAGLAATDLSEMFGAELVLATAADLEPDRVDEFKASAMARSTRRATVWVEPSRAEADGISAVVGYRPNSLICMYTNARTGVRRAVYGSLAERLLRSTDAPVMLFGPEWRHSSVVNLRNMVVCVDASPTAEAAIPLAGAWARSMPLTAVVVHVRTGSEEPELDLTPLAYPLDFCCPEVRLVTLDDAHPVDAVVALAAASTASMVVLATHARTGLDRLLKGSFLADLAARCTLPILVQRGPLPTVRPAWLGDQAALSD